MPIISLRGIVSVVGQVVNLLSAWFAIWQQGGRETGELVRPDLRAFKMVGIISILT